jgi:inosine-uridine nucleoside N-ribohydrolase
MAILAALNSPEVDVIGLTTIFGNVSTSQATKNAFILLNLAGRLDVSSLLLDCTKASVHFNLNTTFGSREYFQKPKTNAKKLMTNNNCSTNIEDVQVLAKQNVNCTCRVC